VEGEAWGQDYIQTLDNEITPNRQGRKAKKKKAQTDLPETIMGLLLQRVNRARGKTKQRKKKPGEPYGRK